MSLSAGMDRSKIHAIRCALSSGPYLTSWIQRPYETASSFGLMTMKHQRMESTKGTAKTLAIWDLREQNQFADYLSHLSTYLNRSHVKGTMAAESSETGGEGSPEVQQQVYDEC